MSKIKENFFIILAALAVAVLTVTLCILQALPIVSPVVYGVEMKVAHKLQEKVHELAVWIC